jgi:hypothetical protein
MGSQFPQIIGGDIGVPLRQLMDDYMSNKVNIPIAAVIVADGHAALFDGVVKVGPQMQMITYDANAASGWSVSVLTGAGTPGTDGPDDFGVVQLKFGGQQVGEHATRLQWNDTTSVKVYQFIGNATLHLIDPRVVLENARGTQCQQDMQIAIQARSAACSQTSNQCDAAKVRVDQTASGCSTPVYEGPLP